MNSLKGSHRPSTLTHQFSQVPKAEIPRSSFDRSHGHKTAFDAGWLIPFYLDEALPGDTFNLNVTALARLSTPIFPLMDNMVLDTHFFAVPYRLVWSNWQKFNGEQTNPGDSTSFTIPTMTMNSYVSGSIHDYMGLPIGVSGPTHSCLWHRAYNLIWNQWFRDENIQNSVTVNLGDGPDTPATYTLLKRGKRHDYFTSCLPWPQKGAGVTIPLGTSANVLRKTNATSWYAYTSGSQTIAPAGGVDVVADGRMDTTSGNYFSLDPAGGLYADLSTATSATINSLRQAFQIQKIYERDARGGTRYIELIKSHFGVTSPDFRLQRPEYLGGGSTPVGVTPIPQTSVTAGTPQGNLAGAGVAQAFNQGFTASFTEHVLIIGLVSVRADLTYQQGLNRMFSRSTRFDFYWPALAQIGEQAVLRKEIYCTGTGDDTVFGYQERYAEYRYKPSIITGPLRSAAAGSLDAWHLAQDFGSAPVLDSSFIVEDPPIDRVIAVPAEPHFIFDSYLALRCARPMPVYGVPGLIDHF